MAAIRLDVGNDDLEIWLETVGVRNKSGGGTGFLASDKGAVGALPAKRLSEVVQAVGTALHRKLAAKGDPDEVAVEFGISADGDGRFLVAETGSFKVSLRWRKAASSG